MAGERPQRAVRGCEAFTAARRAAEGVRAPAASLIAREELGVADAAGEDGRPYAVRA